MNRRFAPKCSTSTGIGVQDEQESVFIFTGIGSHDMFRIVPAKNHAPADRILNRLQIHFEHIEEGSYLALTNKIKTQGNTPQ